MTRRRRQALETKDNTDWVPVDKDCLAAALRASKLSQKELARQVGASQQRINYMFRRGKRCEASLLERISNALDFPESYLKGDTRLPFQAWERISPIEVQFIVRCIKAYVRDIRSFPNEAEERWHSIGAFVFAVYELLRPQLWWRHLLIEQDGRGPGPANQEAAADTEEEEEEEEEEETTEAIITALLHIFERWFEGVAVLDHRKVVRLAQLIWKP